MKPYFSLLFAYIFSPAWLCQQSFAILAFYGRPPSVIVVVRHREIRFCLRPAANQWQIWEKVAIHHISRPLLSFVLFGLVLQNFEF